MTGVLLAAGVTLLGLLRVPRPWLPALACWWYRRLVRCLALDLSCRGAPVAGALLAANHVSWLDIPVLGGLAPLRFVSKAEVRQWPLVGWLATTAGTLFMQRGAHEATGMARRIRRHLQEGASVVIFPEGTTGDGRQLRRFHARLFASAEHDGAAVQPVAIRYGHGLEPDDTAPFVGDDTLLTHLWRVLRHPRLAVTVTFLPPLDAGRKGRRQLAESARAAIATQLAGHRGEAAAARADLPGRHKAGMLARRA